MTRVISRGGLPVLCLAAAVSALIVLAALAKGPSPNRATAASHREAPLISLDAPADITDFFLFRSYEHGNRDKVALIMDVIPGEEPSAGPNYWNFDPNVEYTFNIDNDRDGRADDVRFVFRFKTEIRGVVNALKLPVSYLGGLPPTGTPAVPPITALDGPGSEGLGLRQRYTVTMFTDRGRRGRVIADGLIAVPSNVGPRTMPDYPALAEQGVHRLDGGIRVFAGQRQDPFYIDLGAVFDSLNLRTPGVDMLSGFNVHSIALELPASMISGGSSVIGAYASTSRPQVTVRGEGRGRFVQVQRLANPLVNETIIGTVDKDRWNETEPEDEGRFLDYYLKPRLALALQLATGLPTGCTPFGTNDCRPTPPAPAADLALSNFNRTDLVNILLKYMPSDRRLSELLRLNLSVEPAPLEEQERLTILAGDNAGWPNGRRPRDDVTDIAVQVVGGPRYIAAGAGDNVNMDDAPLPDRFPFVANPADGRNFLIAPGGPQTPHLDPPDTP
jgi:Domain of unknown function (DUF4331)